MSSYKPLLKEKELLARIAEGDEKAFSVLFDRHRNDLYSLVWNLTHSLDMADDVLQEVFLKIWINRQCLAEIDNFEGYLVVVTRRVIINELRRITRIRKREEKAGRATGPNEHYSIEDRLQEKQYADLVNKGMQQLSEQQATVFRMVKQQGLSRPEVANLLQISSETVKTHLERAIRQMRAFLLVHIDEPMIWIIICFNYL